jgi:sensor histidine kinase YesM
MKLSIREKSLIVLIGSAAFWVVILVLISFVTSFITWEFYNPIQDILKMPDWNNDERAGFLCMVSFVEFPVFCFLINLTEQADIEG